MQKVNTLEKKNDEPISGFNYSSNSSFLNSKSDDVIYFRMDSPTQLEIEYEIGFILGEGNFGIVYHGLRKKDKTKCAIKKISHDRGFSVSERIRIDREISILRLVKHPGIIELFAVAESPKMLFLITELCEGDSLSQCIEEIPKHNIFEEYIVAEIIKQIASALSYLHNRSIIHRDLKPGNIMLLKKVKLDYRLLSNSNVNDLVKSEEYKPATNQRIVNNIKLNRQNNIVLPKKQLTLHSSNLVADNLQMESNLSKSINPHIQTIVGKNSLSVSLTPVNSIKNQLVELRFPPPELKIKLIDFGLAIELKTNEEVLADACGTPLYMAPEVLNGRSYTRQCDVWSLGILMLLLLTNEVPFNPQTEEQLIDEINKFNINSVVESLIYISKLAKKCLLQLLNLDPAYRYSAAEFLLNPWLITFVVDKPDQSTNDSYIENNIDPLVRSNTSIGPKDPTNVSNLTTNLRPSSVGTVQIPNRNPATNVLELMKEYHKELANDKLQNVEQNKK